MRRAVIDRLARDARSLTALRGMTHGFSAGKIGAYDESALPGSLYRVPAIVSASPTDGLRSGNPSHPRQNCDCRARATGTPITSNLNPLEFGPIMRLLESIKSFFGRVRQAEAGPADPTRCPLGRPRWLRDVIQRELWVHRFLRQSVAQPATTDNTAVRQYN